VAKERETKTFQGYTVKADSETGIVDAYCSVYGVIDSVNDVVEFGAFRKTITERGPQGSKKIRVLWQHEIKKVIGKPLVMEEHRRDVLPLDLQNRYPEATGALFCRTKFNLDVQQGREAFALYRDDDMDEWSFGFDEIVKRDQKIDGRSIRRLLEVRQWEYSPVTWGANEATITVSTKSNIEMLLDEVRQQHPEYNEVQLVQAVEKRLSPVKILEPVKPLEIKTWHRVESLRVRMREIELRLQAKGNL